MTERNKFATRSFLLRSQVQLDALSALIKHLPLDNDNPLEVVIREPAKGRGLNQNALMWVGTLADIANQAWVNGRQFSAEVWHEYLKRLYLPEEYSEELTKDGYRKWDYTPSGERVLVGSTTQLTKRGFADYLTQVEAHGAEMGVMFTDNRRENERF